ncbi:MAG: esterase-like activity of phytase family protein [Parasphingorhabdus sp.]|nr:esterase-like activity of phytase family protein [Parasphingorhabdus sp.]
MRRIFASLALLLLLLPTTYLRTANPPPPDRSQQINVTPVAIDPASPGLREIGGLTFLKGWALKSANTDFGGFSAMVALPDKRFLLLSDAGVLAGFTLDERHSRALTPFIAPLPDGPPRTFDASTGQLRRKNWDAESFLHDPVTGKYFAGFEHGEQIWRYDASFARADGVAKPTAMRDWLRNGGAEAMFRMRDGRFIVIAEDHPWAGTVPEGLIFAGDPTLFKQKVEKFSYVAPDGYFLTDATLLPDGRALLLHRQFSLLTGLRAIVSIADPAEIRAGQRWKSRPIARLAPPLLVDNMEGIAVTTEAGEPIVWLTSDDNFSSMQRTLLLKFRLNDKAGPQPGLSSLDR